MNWVALNKFKANERMNVKEFSIRGFEEENGKPPGESCRVRKHGLRRGQTGLEPTNMGPETDA